jgi:hypothetical protein
MPSLFPENFTGHRIAVVCDKHCIGLPSEILDGHHADFDGDEMNVYAAKSKASQLEIYKLLNPESNMHSITMPYNMKLSPSKDVVQMCHIVSSCNPAVHLQNIFNMEGSKACFDAFVSMNTQATQFSTQFCLSIDIDEMRQIAQATSQMTLSQFLKYFNSNNFSVKHLLNDSVTPIHIYQSLVRLGHQFFPRFLNKQDCVSTKEISGNLFNGLNAFEQLVHSQCGYSSMVSSINDVSVAGYEQHKLCFNVMDVLVDKQYRLVENERVICDNPLRYHCLDSLMPLYSLEAIVKAL